MIPWGAFDPNQIHQPEFRIELNEHNLFYYVPTGVSQLDRGLDSSMLELAHERQFAVSQLGLTSQKFETDHIARINLALNNLSDHFSQHRTTYQGRANSPHADYLIDLRHTTPEPSALLPPFEIDLEKTPSDRKSSTSSSSQTNSFRKITPPLAIKDLIHPTSDEDSPSPKIHGHLNEVIEPDTEDHFYELLSYKDAALTVWTDELGRNKNKKRVARAQKDTRQRRPSKLRSSADSDVQRCKIARLDRYQPPQSIDLSRNSSMDSV